MDYEFESFSQKISKKRKPDNLSDFLGAEGETRQGFALSLLRKILLYVRAPLPDGKPSHMDYEFESFSQKISKKRKPDNLSDFLGAEGETRTLAPVSRPTPLAGAPRHQLEYFCKCNVFKRYLIKKRVAFAYNPQWRREWDSNPRYVAVRRFSRPFRYNHFGISPYWACIYYHKYNMLSRTFLQNSI